MGLETDQDNGFEIDASDLLKTGVYAERFDRRIPMWKDVDGVQFTRFGTKRKAGRTLLKNFTAPSSINITENAATQTGITPPSGDYFGWGRVWIPAAGSGTLGTMADWNGSTAASSVLAAGGFNLVGVGCFRFISGGAGTVKYFILLQGDYTGGGAWFPDGFELVDDLYTYNDATVDATSFPDRGYDSGNNVTYWFSANEFLSGAFGYQNGSAYNGVLDGEANISVTRGVIGVKEYDTRTAYVGDLGRIYSYKDDDGSENVVGTGYNLNKDASATTWIDTGPVITLWDSDSTIWDEGTNEASRWSFESYGSWVLAANSKDKPQIKKNNVNFNNLHDDAVSGAIVTAGGTGYVVGETISGMAGGGGTGLDVTVTGVSSGAVTAFEITSFGSGFADGDVATGGTASASGTGFTCTVSVPNAYFNTVRIFKKLGPHVLAYNYTIDPVSSEDNGERPFSFAWCSQDDVDTWIASANNSAGSLLIREANSGIRAVAELGTAHAVYTQNQMFLVRYVDAPNYFGYIPAATGVGAVSIDSVISVGRKNFGLSEDGFFETDGTNVIRIGEESGMDQFIQDNVSKSELAQVAGYHNVKENEVVWSVPYQSSTLSLEVYFNYLTRQWGKRTNILTAYEERGVFNYPLSSCSEGQLYLEGSVADSPYTVFATTRAHDLNDPDRVKELSSLRIGKEGMGSPTIDIGWSDTISATPTWVESYVIDDTFKDIRTRTAGRYLSLQINGDSASDDWTITDLIIQGRFEGSR